MSMKKATGIALALLLAMAGYGFGKGKAEPDSFVLINGGTFTMGSPADEPGRQDDEVQHQVTVGSFYMGKYEVTQKEWYEVMGTTIRRQWDMVYKNWSIYGEGDNYPMYYVSWFDAIEYCNKQSQKEGLTPAYTISDSGDDRTATWNRSTKGYRLPTEAEWEYACRARTTTAYNTGANISDNTGWYEDNSGDTTHPVGQKPANAWGLHDMHGNVYEWCWDWYDDYPSGAQTNPAGASSGSERVIRGGSWGSTAPYVRSASRFDDTPPSQYGGVGFRVVRNAQ
jgi:formylglycine-generating enzyme required for sulfatase activity